MSVLDRPASADSLGETMADLIGVIAYLVVASAAIVTLPAGDPLRVVVVLPVVFFLPGYALLAALFPQRPTADSTSFAPDVVERLGLSFGVSVALAIAIGVCLSVVGVGFDTVAVTFTLVGVVAVAAVVAGARRWLASRPVALSTDAFGDVLGVNERTRARRVQSVAVVGALTIAIVVVAATLAVPTAGESYTEFSLFTESDDGTLVTDGYPDTMVEGESEPLVVSLENNEGRAVTYNVVVALQRVETTDAGLRVVEQTELDRLDTRVADGETWTQTHEVTPTMTGEDLRLVYLLYLGDAPANPREATADDHLHVWVTVLEPADEA